MRCWIVSTYEPLPGVDEGARALRCGRLAQRLADDGADVHWITSTFHHVQRRNRCAHTTSVSVAPRSRITMLHAPPYARSVSLARVRHNRHMAAAFGHWWQSGGERPDVIFACVPSLELAEAAVEAGAALRTPVVVDVRDPWPDVYLSVLPQVVRPLARHFLSPEYRRLQRIVQGASAVTAVSGDYLQWALQVAERAPTDHDRVFPIGFAVDPGPPIAWDESVIGRRLSIPDADMVVAFGGMFGTSYDLDTVVEAARLLERTPGHRIRFVIAGDGDKAASLRRRARDLQSLVFCGWLDERDMRALLGRAAVGLAAYAAEAQQSLPNKPFEYMASGLALVSSLTGELADLIAREGIGRQFTARNATSLARELLWLWQHPVERTQMGARAHHLLSTRYHAARIDQSLAEHLRGIAAGGVPVTQDAATLASELPRQEAAV